MSAECFNVVLIEDNEADVYLLRKGFEQTGLSIKVTVIEDGAEALAFTRGEGKYQGAPVPDLAVIDLNLPKKGGIEILEAMRRSERLSAVPVVIMTSSASPSDQRLMESFGVAQFLTKPADLDAFLQMGAVVTDLLAKGKAKRAIQ